MNLTLSEEQQMLAHTVRDVCAKYSTPEIVRSLEDDPIGFSEGLQAELASLGLLGLTISESAGGAGATLLDQAIVCEELGRALCPSPYLESSVLAAGIVRRDPTCAELVRGIADGSEIVVVARHELDAAAKTTFSDGLISGTKILVPFAGSATRLIVIASDRAYLVDPSDASSTQQRTMAADARFMVVFDRAPAQPLAEGFDEALDEALVALAAYAVGGAARAHEMAVGYAKEREQFGRKIGSFQGIAHPLADTATDIEGARALVWHAAWAHDVGSPDMATLSAMAKLYACDVFKRTTKVGQQTFGGIGFMRDVDMQLYFRRAKQLELTWLGPRELEERIAVAELDATSPFVRID